MIDFTGLEKLKAPESAQNVPEQPQPPKAYNNPTREQNAAQGRTEGECVTLQRQADDNARALERAREIYKEYQAAKLAAGGLVSEILRGMDTGESLAALFLKACNALGKVTGDTVLFDVARAKLLDIYGRGLLEPEPLNVEIDRITERLDLLTAALEREQGTDAEKNISRAIQRHREERERLERLRDRADKG